MYSIKQIPEDFIVNEISSPRLGTGNYGYFILTKKDYATQAAIDVIARTLNIPLKCFGYAGNKDRRAITTQIISIENYFDRAKDFKVQGIELEFKGLGKDPISLGELEGNNFEIVVRNITTAPKKIKEFINYFDDQRFSENNDEIGRAIIKKDFKKAVSMLGNGGYEKNVHEFYRNTNDPVGALRKIPMKVLRLYIHAYQSLLWNRVAEKLSKEKENLDLPLVGFGTEFENKDVKEAYDEIMKEENITPRDFVIRSFPELSSEGNTRKLYAEVKDLKISKLETDELNQNMKKVTVSFFLDKGNYATMAIKNMFKELV